MMFLTTRPLWQAGLLLVGVVTLLAMSGPPLVRQRVSLARLVLASGAVPGVVWLVPFGGAVVTVGLTFLGTETLRAQMAVTGALAVLIRSGPRIIVARGHPFAGSVRASPEALSMGLEAFGSPAHP